MTRRGYNHIYFCYPFSYLNELEVVDYKDLVDKQLDEDLLKPSKPTSEKLSHFIQKRESDEAVSENENGKAAEIIPNSDLDQRGGPPNENDNSKNGKNRQELQGKTGFKIESPVSGGHWPAKSCCTYCTVCELRHGC